MKYLFLLLPTLFCPVLQSQSIYADCSDALILCNKDAVVIESLPGAGANTTEVGATSCQQQLFQETNSVWLKWTAGTSGTLDFTILPLDEQDDIDFVLYQLPGSLAACESKKELRCMLAGRVLGEEQAGDLPCTGATGLRADALNISEGIGCKDGSDNFLASLDVVAGESYSLFINNFRSSRGFMLAFSGNCTFAELPGPCNTSNAPVLHDFNDTAISASAVYPNPALDRAQISLRATIPLTGSLLLTDAGGRVLETRTVSVMAGENTLDIPVANLDPGVYFVKMRFNSQVYLSRFYKG